jgi:hypothetical protein
MAITSVSLDCAVRLSRAATAWRSVRRTYPVAPRESKMGYTCHEAIDKPIARTHNNQK